VSVFREPFLIHVQPLGFINSVDSPSAPSSNVQQATKDVGFKGLVTHPKKMVKGG
jgi:hypothetical protein